MPQEMDFLFYISAVPVAACVVLMAMLVAKLMAGELAGV
jgi:hypothetical protein